ncbi:MAG: Fic family protein [Vicinamibacteria bacterium]
MRDLPLYPERHENTGLALARQRDILLSKASRSPERLRAAVDALGRELVFETLRLTGAPVSREAVAKVAGGGETLTQAERVERELIWGQLEAFRVIQESARSGDTLTAALVQEVHRLSMPHDASAGVFRSQPIEAQFGTATPSPPRLIPAKVDNLCDWLGVDSGRGMHPPEKGALAFARLLEISPFEHGNFRTAHLLLSFFALADGYPPMFLRLEHAEDVRQEVEGAMRFETLPLVNRLARSLTESLSFCLDAVS